MIITSLRYDIYYEYILQIGGFGATTPDRQYLKQNTQSL